MCSDILKNIKPIPFEFFPNPSNIVKNNLIPTI